MTKAFALYIPPCVRDPPHPSSHAPPRDKPLRIQIEGPLVTVQRLLPDVAWDMDLRCAFPQASARPLAALAYRQLYGQDAGDGDLVVRDEYLGWVVQHEPTRIEPFDYYGVTFDHLVPDDDPDPPVLQINMIELEATEGPYAGGRDYATRYTHVPPESLEERYIGRAVLALPRCCTRRRGTQDRRRINMSEAERRQKLRDEHIKAIKSRLTPSSGAFGISHNYATGSSELPLKPLEGMCSYGFDIATGTPGLYFSAEIVHRCFHMPRISKGVVADRGDSYADVIALAVSSPLNASRSIHSLQFFAVDVWAYDIALPGGGCPGTASANVTTSA